MTRASRPPSRRLAVAVVAAFFATGCGGDSSGSIVEESAERADATCACSGFDCTTEHIQWFNRMSISEADALEALSAADYDTYLSNSFRAADCQDLLR